MKKQTEQFFLILLALVMYFLPTFLILYLLLILQWTEIINVRESRLSEIGLLFILICIFIRNFTLIFLYSSKNKFPYLNNKLNKLSTNFGYRCKTLGLLLFLDILYLIATIFFIKKTMYSIFYSFYFGLTPIYLTFILFSEKIFKKSNIHFQPVVFGIIEKIILKILLGITIIPNLLIVLFFLFMAGWEH